MWWAFPCVIQIYTKLANFKRLYFFIYIILPANFAIPLILRRSFPLWSFQALPGSKFSLSCELPIAHQNSEGCWLQLHVHLKQLLQGKQENNRTNIVIMGATASRLATRIPISAIATVKNRARVGSPLFEACENRLRTGMRLSREIAWSNLGAL